MRTARLGLFPTLLGLVLIAFAPSGGMSRADASPNICLPQLGGDECLVKPSAYGTGAHTYMKKVRWQSWNDNDVIGYGRLIETGGCCGPSFNLPAKIRVSLPAECNEGGSRIWYSAVTINFGEGFHRRYLQEAPIGPCGY